VSGMKTSSVDNFVPHPGRHYRRQYHWVPDGIYDHQFYQVRYLIKSGDAHITISKMWLDKGGPDDCADDLKHPWGYYPGIPPKP
jgi:hypothetical protein